MRFVAVSLLLGDQNICQVTPHALLSDLQGWTWGQMEIPASFEAHPTSAGTSLLASAVADAAATEGFSRSLKGVSNPRQAPVRPVMASAAETRSSAAAKHAAASWG